MDARLRWVCPKTRLPESDSTMVGMREQLVSPLVDHRVMMEPAEGDEIGKVGNAALIPGDRLSHPLAAHIPRSPRKMLASVPEEPPAWLARRREVFYSW